MSDLKLHLFFPEKYTKNEEATTIAIMLKRAPDRKRRSGSKKGLEVDFSTDGIENGKVLIGSEIEEDTSSDSFDEM